MLAGAQRTRRAAEEGDGSAAELAFVDRLVSSFLDRAPRHLARLSDAFGGADVRGIEDEAHSPKGAAGNIGAAAVMRTCGRLEDDARARTLDLGSAENLRRLRTELDEAQTRLRGYLTDRAPAR